MQERWGAARTTTRGIAVAVVMCGVMWAVEVIDTLAGHPFFGWSLLSRRPEDLWSLATFPFVHYSFASLLVNTLVGGALTVMVASEGIRRWLVVTLAAMLCGGLVGWSVLPVDTPIVGSTTLTVAYLGYLFAAALRKGDLRAALAMLVVGGVYGSVVWAVLPSIVELTWVALVGGVVGGLAVALLPTLYVHTWRLAAVPSSHS